MGASATELDPNIDEGWLHCQGLGLRFYLVCQRPDDHWWKPASLMVRLTHISDWPMHVAY